MGADEYDLKDSVLTKNSGQLLSLIQAQLSAVAGDRQSVVVAVKTINEFEISPSLLDAKISDFVTNLAQLYIQQQARGNGRACKDLGEICYNLAKVRGFKVVVNHFPTDVYLVPKLLQLLRDDIADENELFLVLMWLSSLVLVPFAFKSDMIETFYDLGLLQLKRFSNGSKNQTCSSILVSRFLSRPDLAKYLHKYFDRLFKDWNGVVDSEKLGHLMVINKLLKNCENIDDFVPKLYQIIQYELINIRVVKVNNLNVLYIIKILCKLGERYTKQEDYKMVQQILNNLVNEILRLYNESFETTLRYALAKSLSRLSISLSPIINYHHQVVVYLINQLEIKLPIRVEYKTTKEPKDSKMSNMPVNPFVEVDINFDQVSVVKFHTILLYIGYLTLQRQLPIYLYPTVISITHKTLFAATYNTSIGNQLKDSSCFILWALIRSLNKSAFNELDEVVPTMFAQVLIDLLEVTIFDKDLIIRRCGAAVLQELIGRLGSKILRTEDETIKGEQTIKLIEMFSSATAGAVKESLHLLDSLLELGLDKGIIVDMIVRNIKRDTEFRYQKMLSKKLNGVWGREQVEFLDIGIESRKVFDIPDFSGLEHELYFKSEFCIHQDREIDTIDGPHQDQHRYKTDHFSDDLIEDFIQYYMYCIKTQKPISFQSIIHTKKDISDNLMQMFQMMSHYGFVLSDTEFHSITSHLQVFSNSIFFFTNLTTSQVSGLFRIIQSPTYDYELRTSLIKGVHRNHQRLNIDLTTIRDLVVLLDDYTTTEQGDVGSKIRGAMLDYISEHIGVFKHHSTLKEPLVRICGEPIEKLRLKAFGILQLLDGIQFDSNITDSSYYSQIFMYYKTHDLSDQERVEFVRGLVLSAGGLTGDSNNIRVSFRYFLKYIETETNTNILKDVLFVISKKRIESQKVLKEYFQGLNLIIKLFECNYQFPIKFIKPIYVKAYNLQINCSNVNRLKLTMKLMGCLGVQEQDLSIRNMSVKRLLTVLNTHKSVTIRAYGLQLVYEILLERGDECYKTLESVDVNDRGELGRIEAYVLNSLE